ncbi:DEAD/DEAH box helicase [Clostridium butyricum]|uniref:DEAD/DEAH box helicase n=1 Tax=Clostridium butyricum TaxID=1492 RepID=UPI0022E7B88A|nr:DEAD/DEAH box helicase [Clostridium butyricum]
MSNFHMLCEPLKNKIINKLGWKELTSVQEMTIPEILGGKNAVILAPTAGGKTEAAFFPILSLIHEEELSPISVLYVSPIKALLNNQEERLKMLSSFVYGDVFKWHGDVESNEKSKFYKNLSQILIITPESLEVMLMSQKVNKEEIFKNIRFIVIDEIHAFAYSERGSHLMSILERIQAFSKYDIQRIGLSATVGNPKDICDWMQGSSKRESIVIDPPKLAGQKRIEIKVVKKDEDLGIEVCKRIQGKKALFFSNSRSAAEGLKKEIEGKGIDTYVHHSSIDKRFREIAEEKFKIGNNNCIIATNTLELGIDIGDLDIVLQLDSPNTVSSFLQRMGRTGRRKGTIAHYVFFPTKPAKLILSIAILNLAMRGWVENVYVSKLSYDILFHQILTMSIGEFGVNKDHVYEVLKCVYSFSDISRSDYEYLLNYMVEKKFIQINRNMIHVDTETEKIFGRQNFMTLYSVFETNKEFTVKFKNRSIGTLERWFVNALGEKFQFILAGKYWQTDKIDYDNSIIHVEEAKSAMPPRWMSGEGFYSYELSQVILKVLSTNEDYPFLNNYEKSVLKDIRYEEQAFGLEIGKIIIEEIKDGYHFYTYAGNSVNYTLATAFTFRNTMIDIKSITWNGFKVVAAGKDFKPKSEEILTVIEDIKNNENYFKENYDKLVERVPDISLSKYQKYLPEGLRKKMSADYIYDIEKTVWFIKNSSIKILKNT